MNYCPIHKATPLLPEGANILYCPDERCTYATTRNALGPQPKQPRSDLGTPDRKREPKQKVIEADLQKEVIDALHWRGYEVMETGKTRSEVFCSRCGHTFYPTGWQGNTPALPDLLIRGKDWPVGVWLTVELKGSETPTTEAQQALCDRGGSYISRRWKEVWWYVQITEESWEKGEEG